MSSGAPALDDAVALPSLGHVAAQPSWRAIDVLSDVHLHAEMPRTAAMLERWLSRTDADAVFILGDLFEAWVGDDVAPGSFDAAMLDLLAREATRLPLAVMVGNRDFLLGATALQPRGVRMLADPTLLHAWGRRWLLTHGDALCVDDVAYQRFRAEVRAPEWQRRFLAQPRANREAQARAMRDASRAHQASIDAAAYADVDPAAVRRWLDAAADRTGERVDGLVHGHTHRPADHAVDDDAQGRARHVLGDWDADHAGTPRASLLRLTRDGWRRLDASTLEATPRAPVEARVAPAQAAQRNA